MQNVSHSPSQNGDNVRSRRTDPLGKLQATCHCVQVPVRDDYVSFDLYDPAESLPTFPVEEFRPTKARAYDRLTFRSSVMGVSFAVAAWLVGNYVFGRIAPEIARLF